jgi:hypothetical protein
LYILPAALRITRRVGRRKFMADSEAIRRLGDQLFSRTAGAPLVRGNAVRLLRDAAEELPRLAGRDPRSSPPVGPCAPCLLAVVAGAGFAWLRLLAWPLAALSLWLGLALLARAARRRSATPPPRPT